MNTYLLEGEAMENWLSEVMSKKISVYLTSFIHLLSAEEALSLSIDLYDQDQKIQDETMKLAGGPFVLFYVSLAGVLLFCAFCMPALITMMKGFHVSTLGIELLYHALMAISMVLLFGTVIFFLFLFAATRKKRIVFFVILLYQMKLGFLIKKELSLSFSRLLFRCIQMGIPTKTSIELIKQCRDQPLMVFLAWHVEQVLEQGGNLEEALSISYLDEGLERVMKTAVLSGKVEDLLKGYLMLAEHQRLARLQRAAKAIQMTAYALISVMIVLVYQILFLPLSMLERM